MFVPVVPSAIDVYGLGCALLTVYPVVLRVFGTSHPDLINKFDALLESMLNMDPAARSIAKSHTAFMAWLHEVQVARDHEEAFDLAAAAAKAATRLVAKTEDGEDVDVE